MTGKVILATDDIAAKKVTVELWQSVGGNLFREELDARNYSATHNRCETCGANAEKHYTLCQMHLHLEVNKRYLALEIKEWDEKTPLVLYKSDIYFFDRDSVDDYCYENEIDYDDLQLVICDPVSLREIDEDYWTDCLPDEGELPHDVQVKLKEFNEFLKTVKPVSYEQGNFRTKINQ